MFLTYILPDSEGARIHEAREISDALDVLQNSGHNEVDTARAYGASDDFLGQKTSSAVPRIA